MLSERGATVDVWETEYIHVLSGDDPVKEWVKGTALRPFLDALEPAERAEFEGRCADRLREVYRRRPDGTTLLPFRRLFIVASRRPSPGTAPAASVSASAR